MLCPQINKSAIIKAGIYIYLPTMRPTTNAQIEALAKQVQKSADTLRREKRGYFFLSPIIGLIAYVTYIAVKYATVFQSLGIGEGLKLATAVQFPFTAATLGYPTLNSAVYAEALYFCLQLGGPPKGVDPIGNYTLEQYQDVAYNTATGTPFCQALDEAGMVDLPNQLQSTLEMVNIGLQGAATLGSLALSFVNPANLIAVAFQGGFLAWQMPTSLKIINAGATVGGVSLKDLCSGGGKPCSKEGEGCAYDVNCCNKHLKCDSVSNTCLPPGTAPPSPWTQYYVTFGVMAVVFGVGVFFAVKQARDRATQYDNLLTRLRRQYGVRKPKP